MENDDNTYVPRPRPSPEERAAMREKQRQDAESAVREHFASEKQRHANMARLRALRTPDVKNDG